MWLMRNRANNGTSLKMSMKGNFYNIIFLDNKSMRLDKKTYISVIDQDILLSAISWRLLNLKIIQEWELHIRPELEA